jgi:hypothetical protein
LATGEYLPNLDDKLQAQKNGEEYMPDKSLPGMGGIFNSVNFNGYQYSFNNPIVYYDPDGNQGHSSDPRVKAREASFASKTGVNMSGDLHASLVRRSVDFSSAGISSAIGAMGMGGTAKEIAIAKMTAEGLGLSVGAALGAGSFAIGGLYGASSCVDAASDKVDGMVRAYKTSFDSGADMGMTVKNLVGQTSKGDMSEKDLTTNLMVIDAVAPGIDWNKIQNDGVNLPKEFTNYLENK